MAASNAKQLNIGITCMPVAFSGKAWRDKNDGAENFVPKNRRRSLLPSRKLVLSVIGNIRSSQYGDLVKLTYKLFENQANVKHTTVWRSLKELEAEGLIECHGESNYTIKAKYTDKEYIVIYNFLLNEVLDLGGKVAKQLSRNAVIYLCHLIGFYLNPDNKFKYFQGGDKRAASFLNVAQGTANGVIHELIDVKAIYSHAAKKVKQGKDEVLIKVKNKQKGKSKAEFTIYEVNSKLLSHCKRIQQYYADKRKKKVEEAEEAAKQAKQAAEQPADVVTDNGEEIFIQSKKTKKTRAYTAQARQRQQDYEILKSLYEEDDDLPTLNKRRRSIIEEWAGTLEKLNAQRPPTDEDNK